MFHKAGTGRLSNASTMMLKLSVFLSLLGQCVATKTYTRPRTRDAAKSSPGLATECAPGCATTWLGDGDCNDECYNAACNWDDGDCACYYQEPGAVPCEGFCASGCRNDWIGDLFCDEACQNAACNFDGVDCLFFSSCS